jgi:ribonuclease P protein component
VTGAPSPRPARLTRRAEFLAVAAKGRKHAMPGMLVQGLKVEGRPEVRLGFTCSRKIGNAVARNRARRRLRAAADAVLRPGPAGWDVVLVGRAATLDRPFPALVEDLRAALARIGASP